LDKVYWPKEKYTKGDLLEYYDQIAPFILPYLKDRPTTLHRFPNGIGEEGFYQKNVGPNLPRWVPTVTVQHAKEKVPYLTIPDKKTLLFAVNLGCIDLNPFNSRIQSLDYPDYLVLDLDPESIPFKYVIEVAQVIHKILEKENIPNYCKTSGARGMHIYVPVQAKYPYEIVKKFARFIAQLTHEQLPKITSLERNPSQRKRKVYVDFLQNNFAQTVATAYSVRPKPGATVSTPLDWKEVKVGLDPGDFTMKNMFQRAKKKGDIFKGVLGKGVNIPKILKKLGNTEGM
jgi:bifunctional non-homologous end joining protein LigD